MRRLSSLQSPVEHRKGLLRPLQRQHLAVCPGEMAEDRSGVVMEEVPGGWHVSTPNFDLFSRRTLTSAGLLPIAWSGAPGKMPCGGARLQVHCADGVRTSNFLAFTWVELNVFH